MYVYSNFKQNPFTILLKTVILCSIEQNCLKCGVHHFGLATALGQPAKATAPARNFSHHASAFLCSTPPSSVRLLRAFTLSFSLVLHTICDTNCCN
jgi:hypothetical protein